METKKTQTENIKLFMIKLNNKEDKINLLWKLINNGKINRKQFTDLINVL